jgi:hypothetical protein
VQYLATFEPNLMKPPTSTDELLRLQCWSGKEQLLILKLKDFIGKVLNKRVVLLIDATDTNAAYGRFSEMGGIIIELENRPYMGSFIKDRVKGHCLLIYCGEMRWVHDFVFGRGGLRTLVWHEDNDKYLLEDIGHEMTKDLLGSKLDTNPYMKEEEWTEVVMLITKVLEIKNEGTNKTKHCSIL